MENDKRKLTAELSEFNVIIENKSSELIFLKKDYDYKLKENEDLIEVYFLINLIYFYLF